MAIPQPALGAAVVSPRDLDVRVGRTFAARVVELPEDKPARLAFGHSRATCGTTAVMFGNTERLNPGDMMWVRVTRLPRADARRGGFVVARTGCFACGHPAHERARCPVLLRKRLRTPRCDQCKRVGHVASACRVPRCNACNELGHLARDCVQCLRCHDFGHDAHGCTLSYEQAVRRAADIELANEKRAEERREKRERERQQRQRQRRRSAAGAGAGASTHRPSTASAKTAKPAETQVPAEPARKISILETRRVIPGLAAPRRRRNAPAA